MQGMCEALFWKFNHSTTSKKLWFVLIWNKLKSVTQNIKTFGCSWKSARTVDELFGNAEKNSVPQDTEEARDTSTEYGRNRGKNIEVEKNLNDLRHVNASHGSPPTKSKKLRGTSQKIIDPESRMQVWKWSFAVAAISNWNSVCRNVVDNLKHSNLMLTQFDGAEKVTSTKILDWG